MSCNDDLQKMDCSTNNASMSTQLSLTPENHSVCDPMFESEYSEEFLKALLNDGVDFETASLNLTSCSHQSFTEQLNNCTSANSSGNDRNSSLQPVCLPHQLSSELLLNRCSSTNVQPSLQPASSKRVIKPRTQLSNQEITRLLLIYMSKALASQQSTSVSSISEKSKQICSSSCVQTSVPTSTTTKNGVCSSTSESIDLIQCSRAANALQSNTTDFQLLATEGVLSKSKRKCKKSKSLGTSGALEGLEPMDYSVVGSKESHKRNSHAKIRPFNSLDLPKVHDPLGLMDHTENKVHSLQQPKVLSNCKGVTKCSGRTSIKVGDSEMDLSPLAQILETVKTVPNFETPSKSKGNQKGAPVVDKIHCNTKDKNKAKKLPSSSDQVTPISDIFSTVNNLPNLLDIQSVLKYVQKRKAMRKLFKRRSHSAGSIDDLKKESKSSASLKAYAELLKAKSQRLQKQVISDQSLTNLQSCMTTHSAVNDNDFEFLRSIGIDPNTVTANAKQNDSANVTSCNFVMNDKIQQVTQLQTEVPTGFDNLLTSKDSLLSLEAPIESSNELPFNATHVQCPEISSELLSGNNQPCVLQCNDVQNLDDAILDYPVPMDNINDNIASELNCMEEDPVSHAFTEICLTPQWAHTQGMIKVLIHGPFMSSSVSYVCYFGDLPVEAKLEQCGTLSCVCPASDPGFVIVKVVWSQNVYICSQKFEYRSSSVLESNNSFAVVSKENTWQSDLQSRIEFLAENCGILSEVENIKAENKHTYTSHFQFEQLVVHLLEKLKSAWKSTVLMELKPNCRTTVLHIAVLLSLENVIKKIKEMILSNSIPCAWESEFSPWTQDEDMCSPLMLSCQQGNVTISKLLLEWEPETITLTNLEGVTPVQCALQRGHLSMVAELENWIAEVSENQSNVEMGEYAESDVQQCPYSVNVYPMSSELYATDLEDILQSSNDDLLESHQLNEGKETNKEITMQFSAQNEPTTLSVNECSNNVITSIELVSMNNSKFSSSPMFVTTNPCSSSSGYAVDELASGSSLMFNNKPQDPSLSLSCTDGSNIAGSFPISDNSTTSICYNEPCPDISIQFGEFRTNSPLLSSPSEQSSVISASPSSISVASDSCSVAEICELLGESPSVCQQDFLFPGLSDSEQQEIYCAARTIQHAFRKHKIQVFDDDLCHMIPSLDSNEPPRKKKLTQRHRHNKEKHAAVLIETYYKKYKEMQQMNRAAVLIQKFYRRYRNSLARSKELERAALFIQQMYRYQHRLRKN